MFWCTVFELLLRRKAEGLDLLEAAAASARSAADQGLHGPAGRATAAPDGASIH